MKFLIIIIFSAFLLNIMPLGAFCNDAHANEKTNHSHCVMMCDSVCCDTTVPDQKNVSIFLRPVVSVMLAVIDPAYQNPSLDTLKRPPVFSA
jgi:zona occludens toxin (predicted ATPase)